jgi:small-conductance mechanosensitive channel
MSDTAESILRALLAATSVLAAAYLGFALLQWVARRYSDRYPGLLNLVDRARRPFRFLVGLAAAQVVSNRIAHLKGGWIDTFEHALQIGTIVALVWLAVTIVSAIEDQILKNDLKRERSAVDRRRFETQITLLRRLLTASIVSIGVVAVLLTFPSVASIGTTLVASAGLISIIAGLAAQTSLTNVFAGIQLALSDSVRVGDVIVVNSQIGTDTTDTTGTVTQLTLTHVEMRLWDGRVLILPSAYFIVQPFENLTRNRSLLIGTVSIDVDLSTPVDDIRNEVTRLLAGSDLWDGRRQSVNVSNVVGTVRTLQIGMSAANLDDLTALQALVREQITEYLIQELPDSLVRTRTEPFSIPKPEEEQSSAG